MSKAPPFIVLWREALRRNSGLPPAVRLVGHVMADYADTATGKNVWPGARRLADETGLSLRTVTDHRQALVRAGYAVEESRGGSLKGGKRESSKFYLKIPPTSAAIAPVPVQPTTPTSATVATYRSIDRSPTSEPAPRAPGAPAGAGLNGADEQPEYERVFVSDEPPLPACFAPTPDKRPFPDQQLISDDSIWDWALEVHEERGGASDVDWGKVLRDFISFYAGQESKNWLHVWRQWADRAAAKSGPRAKASGKTKPSTPVDPSRKHIRCDDCGDLAYIIGELLNDRALGNRNLFECAAGHRAERPMEAEVH